jgi:methionine synthase I (cobalamin-dependent)
VVEVLRGIRANASKRSNAELDAAPDLDARDPIELAEHYAEILRRFSWINVIGGRCGTDDRHIEHIRSLHQKTTVDPRSQSLHKSR